MASPTTIAGKRSSMFSVLGNDEVWDKKSVTTLIYAVLDAIAKEFGNLQDSIDAAKADIHLSTVARFNNLQAMWGDMLRENLQGDLTLPQMTLLWKNLLTRLITGTTVDGITYEASTPVNIRQLILDYSLVSACRVFEFWRDRDSMAGALVFDNSLVWNDSSKAWNQGGSSVWLDISTLRFLAFMNTGFQVFPQITGYARDTTYITRAAGILKPSHNLVGFCWMLDTDDLAAPADVYYIEVGTGNSGGAGGCSSPIATVPVSVQYMDAHQRVTSTPGLAKRAIGVIRSADYQPAAEITEACLRRSDNSVITSTYQVFSAVHKEADKPVAMGYYYNEV